jgi:hypothetical protein
MYRVSVSAPVDSLQGLMERRHMNGDVLQGEFINGTYAESIPAETWDHIDNKRSLDL